MSVHKSCVFAYGLGHQSQAQTSLPFGFFYIRYISEPLCVDKIKKIDVWKTKLSPMLAATLSTGGPKQKKK